MKWQQVYRGLHFCPWKPKKAFFLSFAFEFLSQFYWSPNTFQIVCYLWDMSGCSNANFINIIHQFSLQSSCNLSSKRLAKHNFVFTSYMQINSILIQREGNRFSLSLSLSRPTPDFIHSIQNIANQWKQFPLRFFLCCDMREFFSPLYFFTRLLCKKADWKPILASVKRLKR